MQVFIVTVKNVLENKEYCSSNFAVFTTRKHAERYVAYLDKIRGQVHDNVPGAQFKIEIEAHTLREVYSDMRYEA
jgi:uncharacterized protein YfcZ (UPF0381/DUF406 family)